MGIYNAESSFSFKKAKTELPPPTLLLSCGDKANNQLPALHSLINSTAL